MSYKKNLIPALLIALASFFGSFNTEASIVKGLVCDSISNEGVPFATIRIFGETDSVSPVDLFATDENGFFFRQFKANGHLNISFESVGKKTAHVELTATADETIDLGIISMIDDEALLSEVEVVAMRHIVKADADKLSYSVSDDSDSKTYTLLEMLRKVPMVSVDGEDNISVNGSSSFQVYVNGKPSVMFSANPSQSFKSMPASMVKSIEVVTNPGARYDAEGAGGILNIVMDRKEGTDNKGYTASIGLHGGNHGYDANVNVSGQNGKLSYSVNAMHNSMHPGNTDVTNDQIFTDRNITTRTQGSPHMSFTLGTLSADYALDSLSTIGISGAINNFGMHSTGDTYTSITNRQALPIMSYSSIGSMDMNRLSASGTISFSHDFSDRRKSHISVIYQVSSEKNKTINDFDFSDPDYENDILNLADRKSSNRENTFDNIIQADFSTHFHTRHSFDTGIKLNLRKSHSASSLDFLSGADDDNNTRYHNRSNILAAYAEYTLPISRLNAKAGIRYEYTWQDVNYDVSDDKDFSRDYSSLVPSASLSYNLSMSSNIALTYNMRIARPGISFMNPYIDRTDPTSISFGNPYLNPETTHNIGMAYNLFTSRLMLNARLSDSYTGNGIEQYRYLTDGLLTTTYGNVAKRNTLRLDASATWMAASNTRVIMNGSAGYVSLSNTRMNLSNSGFQWNLTAGLQQTFPWDVKAAAYLIASSKSYTIEGWNSGFKMLSINLSKTFLNNRLSISAGLNTGLSKGGRMVIENYSKTSEFESQNTIRVPMLSATIGVSYTIGSYQPKQRPNNRSVESDYMEQRSDMESISGPTTGSVIQKN